MESFRQLAVRFYFR